MVGEVLLGSRTVEQLNDISNPFRETWEKGIGWLIDEPKGRFIEPYLSGDVAIVLRLREPTGGGETVQDGLMLHLPLETLKSASFGLQDEARNLRPCGQKPFVFSPDIELMEGIKKRVPAFVRHERFDSGLFVLRKPRFAFNTLGAEERVQGAVDWKVRFVARFYAISCGEDGRDQVEATSERIDDDTSFGVDEPIERPLWVRGQELIGRVCIRLYHQHVHAVLLPGSEALLEQWDLGHGPIDGSLSV
jgi:hypothetical protein